MFHQRDARNPRPFEPFEWSLATTKDFVHYEDKGVAIPKEGDDSPEQYIFAGSVFEGNHKFHAIYTAYNRDFAAQGKDAQVLMSAEVMICSIGKRQVSLFFPLRKDMMEMIGEIHLSYGRKKANSIL